MRLPLNTSVELFENIDELGGKFARALVEKINEVTARQAFFTLAISGGRTPEPLLRRLAEPDYRAAAPWELVKVFFTDERAVGPQDPQSNYGMAWHAWLQGGPVPRHRIFRMEGDDPDLREAAARYGEIVSRQVPAGLSGFPAFDMILLGLGEDGHVASLFPGTEGLDETLRVAVANEVPQLGTRRLTLTLPVLNAAREIWMVVCGRQKAERVAQILTATPYDEPLPAMLVRPTEGRIVWWLDHQAASLLPIRS